MAPPNLHRAAGNKASRQRSAAKVRTRVTPLDETSLPSAAPYRPAVEERIGNDATVRSADARHRETQASPDPLPEPAPQPSGPRGAQRAAIDALFANDASLRHAVTENLKTFRAEAEEASTRITKAFESFNPIQLPPDERERRHFVARGADMSKVAKAVIEEGLARRQHSNANAKITVQNHGDLKRLIKEKSPKANSNGATIALAPLLDVIKRRQSALTFIGSDPAIALCKAELEAQEIIEQIDIPPSKSGAPLQDLRSTTKDPTVAEFVRDAVKGQMQSAKAPEIQLEYLPSIPNTANKNKDQSRILETFQLRPGPSDVTSYHDFNTLQIAFAHVWTQVFDGQIESLGRELYHEYVKLKSFTGVTDADIRVSTLEDLRRLMATVRDLSQAAQDKIPPAIRGDGGTSHEPKDATDLGNLFGNVVTKGTLGAVLGPIGLFLEEIINEIDKAGVKPRIRWTHFDGRKLPNRDQDKIIARVESNVAASGTIEIALVRTQGQRWRSLEFQQYDPSIGSRPFFRAMVSNNSSSPVSQYPAGPPNDGRAIVLATSRLEGGLLEFASVEGWPSEVPLGRYILGDLSEVLKDGTRATFDWVEG